MIRMVSLWSSISLWADRGDDQRDAGDVIAGRDDLKKPWNARNLLNLREKHFVSPGTTYHAAVQSGPADETSTARDLLQKQVPRAECCLRLT
jgi:hypothetical protein